MADAWVEGKTGTALEVYSAVNMWNVTGWGAWIASKGIGVGVGVAAAIMNTNGMVDDEWGSITMWGCYVVRDSHGKVKWRQFFPDTGDPDDYTYVLDKTYAERGTLYERWDIKTSAGGVLPVAVSDTVTIEISGSIEAGSMSGCDWFGTTDRDLDVSLTLDVSADPTLRIGKPKGYTE